MKRLLDFFFQQIIETAEFILSLIPGKVGILFRRIFYKILLGKVGKKFVSEIRCRIQRPSNVYIGNNSGINVGTIIAANKNMKGRVTIGSNVLIGHGCFLHSGNHNFEELDIPIKDQGHSFAPINVEDNVWIGAKCIILSGVSIGSGSIVAAGSVVTKSVPSNVVVAGNPARVISERK